MPHLTCYSCDCQTFFSVPLLLNQSLPAASLSERAYERLKEEIIRGNLAPGEKLDIYDIAEKLQISRTPVKEAINRLAHQGLVTIRSRKATFVSAIEAETIRELFDIRLMIELWGAERAWRRPDSLDLKRLETILTECDSLFVRKKSFDYERFNQADMEFHRRLVQAARNARLLRTYESLHVHISAMRVYWGRARRPGLNSHNEHLAILRAFCEGRWEGIKSSLTTHIISSRDDVIRVLNERKPG